MSEKKYKTYYDLEIDKLIDDINSNNHKLVLLQFPDGLKYYSKEIIDELKEKTKADYFSYFGTCFGACDIPHHLDKLGFDLCVQWGHAVYIKKKEMW
ncbi:MAG: diphthamide synthesis protein [Candidatus Woesearchaeota archaeon]|jgi:2-(3-amino-3-carboxypropyl)histidine synthase|nr:diphthamide synthesis protein [Candidatus Woesearchaeota archaeon]